ncbi:MAG: dTDP-4-dehydrorhamnose 3,5-epimerase family protein [Candidatus Liptonbacteria bacterium]|nr:dTDP-4-dehydrorhamnose 3,5-epimerase family protein [Candidatus Liptonbacteria bacterium]
MEFVKTKLDGVILVKPDTFEDFRGSYTETYNKNLYFKNGIKVDFVADDYSVSSKYVLRGLHGDDKTWKLIDCKHGRFYFVVLNVVEGSPQYGEWESFTLSDTNHFQVLVPPKFANGHLALTDKIIFHYKQSEYYESKGQFTVRYDDPKFKIWWPIKNPLLSQRDEQGKYVS